MFLAKLTGAAMYEYFENTVSKLPIPQDVDDEEHDDLVKLAKAITEQKTLLRSTRIPFEQAELVLAVDKMLTQVDKIVSNLFALSTSEYNYIVSVVGSNRTTNI